MPAPMRREYAHTSILRSAGGTCQGCDTHLSGATGFVHHAPSGTTWCQPCADSVDWEWVVRDEDGLLAVGVVLPDGGFRRHPRGLFRAGMDDAAWAFASRLARSEAA